MADGLTVGINVRTRFKELSTSVQNACSRAVREATEQCAETARALAPVDTGALRDSIATSYEIDQEHAVGTVEVGMPYGIFQELGTRFVAPHPFIAPAVDAVALGFSLKIGKILIEEAKRSGADLGTQVETTPGVNLTGGLKEFTG